MDLRIFVPLCMSDTAEPEEWDKALDDGEITGLFERVLLIPAWQRRQMVNNSLLITLLAYFASLLCGAAVYPVVVYLSRDNERKTREILDSHLSMMGALGRAIAKRDSETGEHNYCVAWIATRLAKRMGSMKRACRH